MWLDGLYVSVLIITTLKQRVLSDLKKLEVEDIICTKSFTTAKEWNQIIFHGIGGEASTTTHHSRFPIDSYRQLFNIRRSLVCN